MAADSPTRSASSSRARCTTACSASCSGRWSCRFTIAEPRSSAWTGDRVTSYHDGRPPETRSGTRLLFSGLAAIVPATFLSLRLFSLQVTSGGQFESLAQANRTVQEAIPSSRGLIYDRTGRLLVANVASYSVRIRPADLPESQRDQVVATLASLVGMDPADINIAIDSNPGSRFDLVRVASDVPANVASFIAESGDSLPGVQIVVETRREY